MKSKHNLVLMVFCTCSMILPLSIDILQAAEFHVTTAAEFQNALTTARDNGEADTLWLAAGTYNASDNAYAFTYIAKEGEDYDLTIKGEEGTTAENIILDGNEDYEVLSISQGNADVLIEGITANNGKAFVCISIANARNVNLNNNLINDGCIMVSLANDVTLSNTTINYGGMIIYSSLGSVAITNNSISGYDNGAGVYIKESNNTIISNNIITGNTSYSSGGGVYVSSSGSIIISNNTITENESKDDDGGGVYVDSLGDITLTDNTITDNTSVLFGGGVDASSQGNILLEKNIVSGNKTGCDGGGISVFSSKNTTIANNTVNGNEAGYWNTGGAIHVYYFSGDVTLSGNTIQNNKTMGIYINGYSYISPSDNLTINDNVVEGNDGVGLMIACAYPDNYSGSSNINNNIIKRNKNGISVSFSNTTLKNNIIADNIGFGASVGSQAGDNVLISNNIINNTGCGLITGSNSGDIVLINNTIAKNGDRGVNINPFVNIFLTNNTITENKTSSNGGGVYFTCSEENAIAYLYNNIIWGNEGNEGDDIYNESHLYAITYAHNNNFHDVAGRPFTEDVNNIDEAPLLTDDYRLLPDSPCIDKGTASAPELPSTDFEGDSRVIGSSPDIGADEFDPSAPPTTTSIPSTTTTTADGSTTTTAGTNTTTTISGGLCTSELLYGEYAKETELLRYIRDNVLAQTPEGRELIKLYYQWSPVVVKVMEADEEFKEEVKEMIDGVLEVVGGEN